MLVCNERLTLVRHIREDDGDRYECIPINGGSWYRKISIAVSAEGAKPVNTCICRIPLAVIPEGITPKSGDFMVRGAINAVTRAPVDFGDFDYMQITSVGDNRRGAKWMWHWAVSGA